MNYRTLQRVGFWPYISKKLLCHVVILNVLCGSTFVHCVNTKFTCITVIKHDLVNTKSTTLLQPGKYKLNLQHMTVTR